MAPLRPPLEALGQLIAPLNDGELRVARALASQLDDSWTVYIQPRLELDVPDFVAAHDDYGVCAIEVKDWAYNKNTLAPNGTVQYLNANGWNPTDENPRYQAYRYRSTIFEQFFAMPGDGGTTTPSVRAIALILNHSTKHAQAIFANQAAPGPQKTIAIHGEDELHSIEQLIIGPAAAAPQPLSLERFRRHLAVSSVMSELGSPQILSEGARNIEANRNNAKMRRVRGLAGCGKSFGLAARAARLASEGNSCSCCRTTRRWLTTSERWSARIVRRTRPTQSGSPVCTSMRCASASPTTPSGVGWTSTFRPVRSRTTSTSRRLAVRSSRASRTAGSVRHPAIVARAALLVR